MKCACKAMGLRFSRHAQLRDSAQIRTDVRGIPRFLSPRLGELCEDRQVSKKW